jgi:hypothetical protein
VADANPTIFPTGITGYEPYYTEMLGYWRDLYFPEIVAQGKIDEFNMINSEIKRLSEEIASLTTEVNELENRKGTIDALGNDSRGIK